MNLLLDTCGLLALGNSELPRQSLSALGRAGDVFVSPVSAWEVAIKYQRRGLRLDVAPLDWFVSLCAHYRLTEISLTTDLLCSSTELPPLHKDPFDRILIATALLHNLTILTSDRTIPTYPGIKTLW